MCLFFFKKIERYFVIEYNQIFFFPYMSDQTGKFADKMVKILIKEQNAAMKRRMDKDHCV
jgi:hypothetical protein